MVKMHMSYLNIEQGDIVIARVPFSNLEGSKDRPILIVSNNLYNSKMSDVIAVKITSTKTGKFQIKLTQKDLKEGKLKKTSFVEYGFIITIEKSLITQKIGKVKKKYLNKVIDNLDGIFEDLF